MSGQRTPAPMRVGLLGCGNISEAYCQGLAGSPHARLVACADHSLARAVHLAARHRLRALTIDHLLEASDIDIIVNLTPPAAHAHTGVEVLRAGKHLYLEKPLATSLDEARLLIATAEQRGLRIGCAPDTFLGASHQACRAVVDSGSLGAIITGSAHMLSPGMEKWHPNPDFFFAPGGGPILDVGPYHVTQLVHLLGPVARVTALGRIGRLERTICNGPRRGAVLPVTVPTTMHAILQFQGGAVVNFSASWDVLRHRHGPELELFGVQGSLTGPTPNFFGGSVEVYHAPAGWQEVDTAPWPFGAPNLELPDGELVSNRRGLGVTDMAAAIRRGVPHRASAELAYHVLDVLLAIEQSSANGVTLAIGSTVARPAPLPPGSDRTVFAHRPTAGT